MRIYVQFALLHAKKGTVSYTMHVFACILLSFLANKRCVQINYHLVINLMHLRNTVKSGDQIIFHFYMFYKDTCQSLLHANQS